MPYQETIICGDEKPEEYRLALNQSSLQSQSVTQSLGDADESDSLQPQRQVVSDTVHCNVNRYKMHATGLPAPRFHSLSVDSGLRDNFSFGNNMRHSMSEICDSGCVSGHASYQGNSSSNGGVSSSIFNCSGKLPSLHGRMNSLNLFASTQSDGALYSKPTFRQNLASSLPANFPESCDDNVLDLNEELVQESSCVLSPHEQPKRRRLKYNELVDQEDAYRCYDADLTPSRPKNEDQINDAIPPMGLTPIMFSFPRNDKGEGDVRIRATPLPPFHQSSETRKQNRGHSINFHDVQFDPKPCKKDKLPKTPYSSEPLCLPPKRKNKSVFSSKRKTVASSPSNSPISPAHSTSSSVATPSSAAIVKISTEIRNQTHSSFSAVNDSATDPSGTCKDVFSITKFATSMEASQYSQQSIHDWDTKFGLRHAHSKRMRESARSRKNVLEFLKGEGSELLQRAKESTTTMHTHFTSSTLSKSVDKKSNEEKLPTGDDPRLNAGDLSFISGPDHDASDRISEEHKHDDKSMGWASIASFSHSNELVQFDEHHMSDFPDDISTVIDEELERDDQSIDISFIRSHSNEQDLNRNASSYSSKLLEVDINDEELTNMFRRASLDHMPENIPSHLRLPSSLTGPMSEETDVKQVFAKGA